MRIILVILALFLAVMACERTRPEGTPARIPEASKTATVSILPTQTPYPIYTRQPEVIVTVLVEVTREVEVTRIVKYFVIVTPTPTPTETPTPTQ